MRPLFHIVPHTHTKDGGRPPGTRTRLFHSYAASEPRVAQPSRHLGTAGPARRAPGSAPRGGVALPDVLERLKIEPDALPVTQTMTPAQIPFRGHRCARHWAAVSRDRGLLTHDPATTAVPRIEYLLSLGISRVGPIVGKVPRCLATSPTTWTARLPLQALGEEDRVRAAQSSAGPPRCGARHAPSRRVPAIHRERQHRVLDNAPNAVRQDGGTQGARGIPGGGASSRRGKVGTMTRWPQLPGCDLDNTISQRYVPQLPARAPALAGNDRSYALPDFS